MDFVPSLENLAFIRLGISLYHNPNFEEIKRKSKISVYYFDGRESTSLLRERLSDSVLPKKFHEKFLDIFEPLCIELWYWEREMSRDYGLKQLHFYLKSSGTIDIVETIKRFVRSEDHDITQRFAMACHFWLTDDVLQIWNKSSIYERIDIEMKLLHGQDNNDNADPVNQSNSERTLKIHECLKKWFDWLHEGAYPRAMRKFVNESFFLCSHVPPDSDLLGRLSPEHLQKIVVEKYVISKPYGRAYFLCLAYNQRMSFFQREPEIILRDYLNWPLQPKFLEMASQSWMYLTRKQFYRLLLHISCDKICNRFGSKFDYESLFHEFWRQSPLCLKVLAKEFHYSFGGRTFGVCRKPEDMKTPLDRIMENAPDRVNLRNHECCRNHDVD